MGHDADFTSVKKQNLTSLFGDLIGFIKRFMNGQHPLNQAQMLAGVYIMEGFYRQEDVTSYRKD